MTEPKNKNPNKPDGTRGQKRPKGFGGLLLIMMLLAALFVLVAQSNQDPQSSIYDFYRRLFAGEIKKLELARGTATATYDEREGASRRMEVVLDRFAETDLALMREIQALLPADVTTFSQARGGLTEFINAVERESISVRRAIFVSVKDGRLPAQESGGTSGSFLGAIVQDDQGTRYVRIDGGSRSEPGLLATRKVLAAKGVAIEDRALSLDRSAFAVREPNTTLLLFFSTVAPYLLVILIVWFFIFRQMRAPGGGGVLSFGRSRAALYTKENRTHITFDDVAGVDEAKDELKEIIEFLKNPGKFAKLGGSIPRGVLLVGSPGTGKTLMAKAIAGEAEVPFFSISGSDFVEMFVGVGASRVRDLFKQARECSPCLVFLDEIDAVGRKRGSGMGGGHDEREQTLNAILVEMDGFDSDKGIILIGATNRPDVLDPALLRPGRFDRQVVIDKPDVKGREAILKVHARKVRMSPHVDTAKIARATPNFSGADLAAVINEAAILAAMKGKESVEMSDLEEARDRVLWGREKRSRAREQEELEVTAVHEAGHALVTTLLPELDPVHKVTIISRGMALGATFSLPEKDDYNLRRKKLLARIAMCYGGRAAEEIVFGDISAGAQNDIEKATGLARIMVCELGMSDVVGPVRYTSDGDSQFLGREFNLRNDISEQTMQILDREVRAILDTQYQRAVELLRTHLRELRVISDGLLRYETLSGEEVSAIVRGDSLDEYRAASDRRLAEERAAFAKADRESARRVPGAEATTDGDALPGAQGLAPS